MTWSLRSPLPIVPIPLLPEDPEVPLDLQAVFHAAYEPSLYDRRLPYDQPLFPARGHGRRSLAPAAVAQTRSLGERQELSLFRSTDGKAGARMKTKTVLIWAAFSPRSVALGSDVGFRESLQPLDLVPCALRKSCQPRWHGWGWSS